MNPKDMTNKELLSEAMASMLDIGACYEGLEQERADSDVIRVELLRRLNEIDALRNENYNASQACLDYQSEHEELEKDKERLSWLAHETFLPKDHPTTGVFAVVCEDVAPLGTFGDFGEADELAFRAMIDTAREASHE